MCKRRIKIRICIEGRCKRVEAELHPAGCMKASRTHLDLPENALPQSLVEVAARRGYRFNWRYDYDKGCISLEDPLGIIPRIAICGDIPRPRGVPLLRRLKRGRIYLGL